MYDLEVKKEFIVIRGSDIIDEVEATKLCDQVVDLLADSEANKLLLDVTKVDLEKSNFDVFIQALSKLELDKIALVLEELISQFKFNLWRRKYRKYVTIEQFSLLTSAQEWLGEE